MKSVKGVRFGYRPTLESRQLLQTFRVMVNHAIHISLTEGVKGRLKLRDRIYREFKEKYGVVSCYPYSVAEVAWSIVKKHRRWQRAPIAHHLMMKMDSASYSLNPDILSLPSNKGERLLIALEYGEYQRHFLMDEKPKRGSVTMTEGTIIIAFSKETEAINPVCRVGIDLNEKSAALSDGTTYNLSEVARLHTEYGVRRRDFYKRHPHDERLKRKLSSESKEKGRIKQLLHHVSKQIVEEAKQKKAGVVLERLKGIRYTHQRGNGMSRASRRRISQWPFRELQNQIEYKAGWDGVQVEYVSAAWTSKQCHICGFINRKLKLSDRDWRCPSCGATLDRDLNAAINIERRGTIACLGEVRPGARGV